jgi:pimeloyl-ACP methyl ester carboxylesterase
MVESQRLELGRGAVHEWLGRDAELRPELDPMVRPPIKAETLFIHGNLDERVPLQLSQKYVEAMKGHGKTIALEVLPGTSHFEMMNIPSSTFDALIRAIG